MRIFVVATVILLHFQGSDCSMPDGEIFSLEDGDKSREVDMQNQIRRDDTFYQAADMRKLFWDESLASKCQDIVKLCPEISNYTDGLTENSTDETVNLYYKENTYSFMQVATEAFTEWKSQTGLERKQYWRLYRGSSSRVGCSAAHCGYGGMLCCMYGPVPLNPTWVYELGVECSGCEKTDFCDDKLCVSCAERNVTTPASCATDIAENTTYVVSTPISTTATVPASTTSAIPAPLSTSADGTMSTKSTITSTSDGASWWARSRDVQAVALIALLISLVLSA